MWNSSFLNFEKDHSRILFFSWEFFQKAGSDVFPSFCIIDFEEKSALSLSDLLILELSVLEIPKPLIDLGLAHTSLFYCDLPLVLIHAFQILIVKATQQLFLLLSLSGSGNWDWNFYLLLPWLTSLGRCRGDFKQLRLLGRVWSCWLCYSAGAQRNQEVFWVAELTLALYLGLVIVWAGKGRPRWFEN